MDNTLFAESFRSWTEGLRKKISGEIVAIDGKTLRGSHHKSSAKSAIHMVSAFGRENGLVLGQIKLDEKSNEITAIPQLLRTLELSECIVTIDAMSTQKEIAREIREADADYVLTLKGNHETALEEVSWFQDRGLWEGLRSFGMVESLREIDGVITRETRFFLTSIQANAKTFARAVRGHWAIENSLHWSLDVCFAEDACRIRLGYAAENMAILRHIALNVLKNDSTKKRGIKGKQKNASWDHSYLLSLLRF